MKNFYALYILLFFVITTQKVNAQAGEWVWIHGDSAINNAGNYGTQGVSSPSNVPPALYEANEWTDASGKFWLYGGILNNNFYSDLWRYDPATNEWTWMKGTKTFNDTVGSYGTKGVSAPSNHPPSIGFGAATWTDNVGNLWLFGGYCSAVGAYYFSDLWKYDVGTNEWTWMKGPGIPNQAATYGTQGIPNIANNPGARCEFSATWVTSDTAGAGNLWLFGGFRNAGSYNDLWRYNIATNTWTWMKGSTSAFQSGTYGTQGVEATANTPGGRCSYSTWKDKSGNLWLFGGFVYSSSYTAFNDLWRYNPLTNNWMWVNGSTTNNAVGLYGTKCTASSANHPGARLENRAVWTDADGNFWMFGGALTALGGSSYKDLINDLWMYCVSSGKWIWMSGDTVANKLGNWGSLGVTSPTNVPNGRSGAIAWKDNSGQLYFFGGHGSPALGTYNDLWKFTVDPCCGACSLHMPTALFTASDTAFCNEPTKCIDFFDQSTGCPSAWKWIFTGGYPDTSLIQNPTQICYPNPGKYPVTLIVTNSGGTDTLIYSPMIYVASTPAVPTITVIGGDTLISSYALFYQWYYNGNPIAGATDSFYIATKGGTYAVMVKDSFNCSVLSNGTFITSNLSSTISGREQIKIYPNPSGDWIEVSGLKFEAGNHIDIYTVLGEKLFSREIQTSNSEPKISIDVSSFRNGIYFLQIYKESQSTPVAWDKFVVLHK